MGNTTDDDLGVVNLTRDLGKSANLLVDGLPVPVDHLVDARLSDG